MTKEELAFLSQCARDDLISFCVYTDKFFEINKHHEIIGNKLQDFMEWKIKRLILQTPPRSWKSRLICEAIAHWMWKLKNTDIIYTGHSINLLESFSRNIRWRVDSPEYKQIFKASITDWNSALNQWSMTNGNQLMIYGVGGWITGKWGHRLIIDDPYATRQDAESDTMRKRVYEWYNSTFYSRRHNQDAWICLIMQRWREDDLVWEVMWLEDWEVIKIPAISPEWESFWASRFSVQELNKIRNQIWDYFFQSQYQQDPFMGWSGLFKNEYFTYHDDIDFSWMKRYTFIDPAISLKQDADYTAIVTIWVDDTNKIYVLNIIHERLEPDSIINAVFSVVNRYNPDTVWIEVVAYQKMLALSLRKEMENRNRSFYLEEVHPMWEKEARIKSILQPRYASLSIKHNSRDPKTKDLELELQKFPNGKHDDIIDSLSWAVALATVQNNNGFIIETDYSQFY